MLLSKLMQGDRHTPRMSRLLSMGMLLLAVVFLSPLHSSTGQEAAVHRDYSFTPAAPIQQSSAEVQQKSAGCVSCHVDNDLPSMHANPAVKLGCVDCHGGDSTVVDSAEAEPGSPEYVQATEQAHVLPLYPDSWEYPSSANPERTYTLLNNESREFIRFINPSDYRVADDSCGACHQDIIEASKRSMHSTGVMLMGGAAYNNGILPFKQYNIGEAYDDNGVGVKLLGPVIPEELKDEAAAAGILPVLYPLPAWETVKPGDVFRVFEVVAGTLATCFRKQAFPAPLDLSSDWKNLAVRIFASPTAARGRERESPYH